MRYEGRKLLPDVDERCEEVAGYITPRVGGVGPTTIAMLFRNAVEAAERKSGSQPDDRDVCPLCGAEQHVPASAARSATSTPASVRTGRARSRAEPCGP